MVERAFEGSRGLQVRISFQNEETLMSKRATKPHPKKVFQWRSHPTIPDSNPCRRFTTVTHWTVWPFERSDKWVAMQFLTQIFSIFTDDADADAIQNHFGPDKRMKTSLGLVKVASPHLTTQQDCLNTFLRELKINSLAEWPRLIQNGLQKVYHFLRPDCDVMFNLKPLVWIFGAEQFTFSWKSYISNPPMVCTNIVKNIKLFDEVLRVILT